MNILELDFRYSMVKGVFTALTESLRSLEKEVQNSGIDFDIEFLVEKAEWVLGIAFVTAQTYITGTVTDASRLMKGKAAVSKKQLSKDYSKLVEGMEFTEIELCDAIANYFKHHEEWETWEPNSRNKTTILTLAKIGITNKTSFPCYQTAVKLWPEEKVADLDYLLEILVNWRTKAINSLIME